MVSITQLLNNPLTNFDRIWNTGSSKTRRSGEPKWSGTFLNFLLRWSSLRQHPSWTGEFPVIPTSEFFCFSRAFASLWATVIWCKSCLWPSESAHRESQPRLTWEPTAGNTHYPIVCPPAFDVSFPETQAPPRSCRALQHRATCLAAGMQDSGRRSHAGLGGIGAR